MTIENTTQCVSECRDNYTYSKNTNLCVGACTGKYFLKASEKHCYNLGEYPDYYCIFQGNKSGEYIFYEATDGSEMSKYYNDSHSYYTEEVKYCINDCQNVPIANSTNHYYLDPPTNSCLSLAEKGNNNYFCINNSIYFSSGTFEFYYLENKGESIDTKLCISNCSYLNNIETGIEYFPSFSL